MQKIIVVTSGEPAGIGPDLCLSLAHTKFSDDCTIVVLADINLLKQRAQHLGYSDVELKLINSSELKHRLPKVQNQLLVLHHECANLDCSGKLNPKNAPYVLGMLDHAVKLCQEQLAYAMVTAPISKENINAYDPNLHFSGHTEYLAQKCACDKVVMMLANAHLKVALLTTHLPLAEVPKQITSNNLDQTLTIINQSFKQYFAISNPKIGVCGLNPHAGENGYLGLEEIEIINPVIQKWQERGYNIVGSLPADTIYCNAHKYDVILAMYHDQGLPVLKYSDFKHAINVTLGLPIIRTSVDHGIALELVGTNQANNHSLINAIKFALNPNNAFN